AGRRGRRGCGVVVAARNGGAGGEGVHYQGGLVRQRRTRDFTGQVALGAAGQREELGVVLDALNAHGDVVQRRVADREAEHGVRRRQRRRVDVAAAGRGG